MMYSVIVLLMFFFFNDTATTEIYTLSLHDALPICTSFSCLTNSPSRNELMLATTPRTDRKSTRLNSSHSQISYAVFCLKKKKTTLGGQVEGPRGSFDVLCDCFLFLTFGSGFWIVRI